MKKLLLSWWWLGMLPAFNLWAVPGAVRLDPATTNVALKSPFGLKMMADSGTKKVGTYDVKLSYDVSKIKPDDSNNSATGGCVSCVTAGIISGNTANIGAAGNPKCPAGNLCINAFDGPGKGPGAALHLVTANFKCLEVAGSFPIGLAVQVLTNEGGETIGTPTGKGSTVICGSLPPDFVITSIQVPKAGTPAAVVGGTFTAAITVKNQGTAPGDGKTLSVWNHGIAVPVCSGDGVSKQAAVGILAANASTTITVAGIPAGTIAGMKLLRAVVDSTCATAETNETNNQATLAYPVTKTPGADLTITSITLTPTTAAMNGTFTATVAVKNQSTTASVAGTLSVWNHRPDVAYCGATGASKQVAVPSIAANTTKSIVVSGIPAGAAAGMKRLRAYVDSGCTTPETNELNNQGETAYAVNAPAPAADFSITTITLSPVSPNANTAFNATIVIKNNSTTTAGDGRFLDAWSHNTGLPPYCGMIGNKRIPIGIIAKNATVTKTITGLVAAAGATGTRKLQLYVDSACGTNETNEGNNQLVKTY